MKQTLILLFFFVFQNVNGQFAVIKDTDGFVYIRKTPEITGKIESKINNGQVVFCYYSDESKNNWFLVEYGESFHEGYIHRTRFKYLSEFENIPVKEKDKSKMIFHKDSIKVLITKIPFIAKNNKLQYDKNGTFLEKINGKKVWGEDGGMPKFQYGNISVQIGSNKFDLQRSSHMDLFEPSLTTKNSFVSFDKEHNRLYIYASNSDGAGAYDVVWIIENCKYIGRRLSMAYA